MGKGVSFVSPSKDLEFEKIRGQDGEIAIGDGTLNNIKRDFPFKIEPISGCNNSNNLVCKSIILVFPFLIKGV